jgi:hypothetical protein
MRAGCACPEGCPDVQPHPHRAGGSASGAVRMREKGRRGPEGLSPSAQRSGEAARLIYFGLKWGDLSCGSLTDLGTGGLGREVRPFSAGAEVCYPTLEGCNHTFQSNTSSVLSIAAVGGAVKVIEFLLPIKIAWPRESSRHGQRWTHAGKSAHRSKISALPIRRATFPRSGIP